MFDPRHGTTCHPDHQETGRLVLEAVERLETKPALYLLETRVTISNDPLAISFAPATTQAIRFDATQWLESMQAEAWNAIVLDMERHPSQFPREYLTAIQSVPPSERGVFLAPAASALEQSVEPCR